jgi:HK97 family phage major capsid protein
MSAQNLIDQRGRIEAKRNELAAFYESKRVNGELKLTASADAEFIRAKDAEIGDLCREYEAMELAEIQAQNQKGLEQLREPLRPGLFSTDEHRNGSTITLPTPATLGDALVNEYGFKSWKRGAAGQHVAAVLPFKGDRPWDSIKATFTTAGSTLTGYDRQPGIVMIGVERLTVADLLAQGRTESNTIRYVREDTYTNAATMVTEGLEKPEASWDTSEVDAPVRKAAVVTKVTDELWSDFPAIRSYINERLPFMVREREEAQLLAGDGNAPNITGLLTVATIQSQATGADTNPDAIYKAITKVRTVGFFEPDGVVVHPSNWTPIRLLKTTTGEYVWGHPAEMGPERIWGLRVVVTTAITANTGLVGAFRLGAQVFYREGLRIEATNSNEDDFLLNLIAIRAETRFALAVYRPKAFCQVTTLGT